MTMTEDERYALWVEIDGLIGEWLSIELDIARAATGDMTDEERAKQKCLDYVQYLALSQFSPQLTPKILDVFERCAP